MVANQDKLGLYKKIKLDKVKKELEEIQSNGKESILLIAKRLEKELIDQGYKVGIHIAIWHFEDGTFQVEAENKKIEDEEI